APQGFKEVSYDYPPSETVRTSAISAEERAKILEWSRQKSEPQPLVAAPAETPKKPIAAKRSVDKPVQMLQLSSFETLPAAQSYWAELSAKDAELALYAPIYREVSVNGKQRYRTYIADTAARLRRFCARLAEDLKSCLIRERE
ncbi:MAG TPA: hypothetical protein DD624_00880, partial [Alphaproteobacteria bacterium]|nr:hypothetical protein [Alphaproteobacteria bacterium]